MIDTLNLNKESINDLRFKYLLGIIKPLDVFTLKKCHIYFMTNKGFKITWRDFHSKTLTWEEYESILS